MTRPDPVRNRPVSGGGRCWYPSGPVSRVDHVGKTGNIMCYGHDIQGNPIRLRMTQDQARTLGTALTHAANHTRRPTW